MPALIFDCDGVLADTEQHGHLPAFNQAFAEFGIPVHWTSDDYAAKVRIGGGKERISSVLTSELAKRVDAVPVDTVLRADLVVRLHHRKTELYTALVSGGALPARPGVARIARAAANAGWDLAVASTSAESSVRAVLEHVVGYHLAKAFRVFAGDAVVAKKPAPDIYLLALSELRVDPDDAVVIEDSEIGHRAALAAGLRTVVTVSGYTRNEDFAGASLVVTSLGDRPPGEPAVTIADPLGITPGRLLTLDDLVRVRVAARPTPAQEHA